MLDAERMKSILREVFDEQNSALSAEHAEQHEWLAQRIKAERERKLMYRAIARAAVGWSIPVLLTGFAIFLQTGHWPKP